MAPYFKEQIFIRG